MNCTVLGVLFDCVELHSLAFQCLRCKIQVFPPGGRNSDELCISLESKYRGAQLFKGPRRRSKLYQFEKSISEFLGKHLLGQNLRRKHLLGRPIALPKRPHIAHAHGELLLWLWLRQFFIRRFEALTFPAIGRTNTAHYSRLMITQQHFS